QKQGNVGLTDDSVREASRSKLQKGPSNSGSVTPDGAHIAPGYAGTYFNSGVLTTPASPVAVPVEEAVRQQPSSIVLPSVQTEAGMAQNEKSGKDVSLFAAANNPANVPPLEDAGGRLTAEVRRVPTRTLREQDLKPGVTATEQDRGRIREAQKEVE